MTFNFSQIGFRIPIEVILNVILIRFAQIHHSLNGLVAQIGLYSLLSHLQQVTNNNYINQSDRSDGDFLRQLAFAVLDCLCCFIITCRKFGSTEPLCQGRFKKRQQAHKDQIWSPATDNVNNHSERSHSKQICKTSILGHVNIELKVRFCNGPITWINLKNCTRRFCDLYYLFIGNYWCILDGTKRNTN